MKAVILCGGQGTRIRSADPLVPKPMLEIGGRPIVWHIMRGLAQHGIDDFVLCLGHRSEVIKRYFLEFRMREADLCLRLGSPQQAEIHGEFPEANWRVTLAETGEFSLTGSRIAAIRPYVESDEPFVLTYGDGVSDVDVTRLLEFHRHHGKVLTVTAVRTPSRFGELDLEGTQVVRFVEKSACARGRINGGFFVCDGRKIWDYVHDRGDCVFEREPLEQLAAAGQLEAFVHDGYWQCMDTPAELAQLEALWSEGQAPWRTW